MSTIYLVDAGAVKRTEALCGKIPKALGDGCDLFKPQTACHHKEVGHI
jgi:hypothetical protein